MLVRAIRRLGVAAIEFPALLAAIAVVLASDAAGYAQQKQTEPKPALWRITDEDSTLWIFGSIHALEPGTRWRRPELDAALEAVEIVYFETPGDVGAMLVGRFFIDQFGAYPPGERLRDKVSPALAEEITEVAASVGITPQQLDQMRPWLAALSLEVVAGATLSEEAGVDMVLEREARGAGKELRYLETIEQQLGYFADLPERAQLLLLEQTMRTRRQKLTMFSRHGRRLEPRRAGRRRRIYGRRMAASCDGAAGDAAQSHLDRASGGVHVRRGGRAGCDRRRTHGRRRQFDPPHGGARVRDRAILNLITTNQRRLVANIFRSLFLADRRSI